MLFLERKTGVGEKLGMVDGACEAGSSHSTVQKRSDVESQESCGHLILSDTLFPRSFSSFSVWIKGTDKRTENGHKYGHEHG
jgi:hypothetical protein